MIYFNIIFIQSRRSEMLVKGSFGTIERNIFYMYQNVIRRKREQTFIIRKIIKLYTKSSLAEL